MRRGERRAQARLSATSFDRLEQRGLFAADVRAGAAMDDQVEVVARTHDVLAEDPGLVGLRSRALELPRRVSELAAAEDVHLVGSDRVRADGHALDQLVRVALHQLAVLERPRLAFVRVADEVARADVLRDEAPLRAGGE